jgi:hypothetical protein
MTTMHPGHTMAAAEPVDTPLVVTRRRVDQLLVVAGLTVAAVLVAAGALLVWGSTFADDYVSRELTSQQIFFPPREALEGEGRSDLFAHAGQQVTQGSDAEAYASYIDHHLDAIADGQTYAQLGTAERAAKADLADATAAGGATDEVAALQAKVETIAGQRDSLFRGETLRGLLLSTYAWSTVGSIAFIAAIVSFAAAGVLLVLVVLGLAHLRRQPSPAGQH